MAAPALTHTGERLYESLAPLTYAEEANGWALAYFCAAAASTIDEIADITRDAEDGTPGYSSLYDLDTVAEKYLPWLAQFIGVQIPEGLTDEGKRIRIRETDGFRRGTPAAIMGAARQYLIGDKTVYLVERHGSAYRLTVASYSRETPDRAAAEAAIREQVPAGIVLHFSVIDPQTFDELRDSHVDFDDVLASYVDFDAIWISARTFDDFRDTHVDFDDVTNVFINFSEIIVYPTKQWDYEMLRTVALTYAALGLNYTDYDDLMSAS